MAVSYLWGTVWVAAMASLASFAILKTTYILCFERVNEIDDVIIVNVIKCLTFGLAILAPVTELLVKVKTSKNIKTK